MKDVAGKVVLMATGVMLTFIGIVLLTQRMIIGGPILMALGISAMKWAWPERRYEHRQGTGAWAKTEATLDQQAADEAKRLSNEATDRERLEQMEGGGFLTASEAKRLAAYRSQPGENDRVHRPLNGPAYGGSAGGDMADGGEDGPLARAARERFTNGMSQQP